MSYRLHWTEYLKNYTQNLKAEVENAVLRGKNFERMDEFKKLKLLREAFLQRVPQNPGSKEYQLGNSLGQGHKNWRRVKFVEPLKRYRLFFAYSSAESSVCYVWINSNRNLRSAAHHSDCYAAFSRLLDSGKILFPYPDCQLEKLDESTLST